MVTFRQFRKAGQLDEAMAKLLQLCRSKNSNRYQSALRTQIFSQRCLILDWAAQRIAVDKRAECRTELRDIRKIVLPLVDAECQGLMESRLRLIEAMTDHDGDALKVQEAIEYTVQQINDSWNYRPHAGVMDAQDTDLQATPDQPLNGPAFLKQLRNSQRPEFNYDAIRLVFHNIASDFGWMHPGILLAGETLAALESGGTKANFKTTTWLMFAAKTGGVSHGVLARLTMERLPGGRGLLVPDAFASGYHQMADSFSTGFQHAWLAARMAAGKNRSYDWRWRIEIEEATRDTPFASILSPAMEGPSAEGALTCALLAVGRGEHLDRNTCMSAKLSVSTVAPWLQSTLELAPIDKLDAKTLADRLRLKKIRDIIVSDQQTEIEIDTGSGHNFIEVTDVATAESHFGIWPKITRAVRAGLHREATQLRKELCGDELPKERRRAEGRGYVPSAVSVRLPAKETGPDGRLPKPLSSSELREFSYGRWKPQHHHTTKPVRLRLFADSGMGKTVQLIVCEQKISGDDTFRIPIRLGRRGSIRKIGSEQSLEGIGWTGRRDEDLKQLAMVHLQAHVPKEHTDRSADWIVRMAELGQVFFLLDALDQTRSDLELMATFLKTVPNCPVLVAGRPESLTSQASFFENQEWTTLELQKLDRARQERFLGTTLSTELMNEKEELRAWAEPEERRKHQWKDLLSFPLLISLLKKLAERDAAGKNQLDGISNRYSLYRKAVDQLFLKGLRSIADAKKRDDLHDQASNLMKAIAGHMVCHHNFDVVEGEELDCLRDSISLPSQELRDLVQLDIIKEYAFLERIELEDRTDDTVPMQRGIEWRHRSFLEYYGALFLAELWNRDSHAARTLLRDVHEILDANGSFLLRHMKDATAGKNTPHRFRNLRAEWHWTLRFLLAHLAEPNKSELALELVSLSNPWIVCIAMNEDHLQFDHDVTLISRWLVQHSQAQTHWINPLVVQTSQGPRNVKMEEASRAFDSLKIQRPTIVEELLHPALRDASILTNLRTLLKKDSWIRRFWCKRHEFATAAGYRRHWLTVTTDREQALQEFLLPNRWISGIPGYPGIAMSDFPVTNAVFEAFCASHNRHRGEFSYEHDDPVVYVSWHMAQEFCSWLSEQNPRHRYFLPNEDLWEAACRWGTPKDWSFWWGDELEQSLFWHNGGPWDRGPATLHGKTRSRCDAIAAAESAGRWHPSGHSCSEPGVLDLLGNVWEWCGNRCHKNDFTTVALRGGSWSSYVDSCLCGTRTGNASHFRSHNIGFRLCRR